MIPTDLLNMLAKVFDNKKYMVNIKTGSIDMFSIKLGLRETEDENKILASVSLILKDKEYTAQKEVASDEIRQIVDEMNMALTSPNNSFKMFDLVSSLIDYALSETNIKNDYVPLECLFRQSSLVVYTDGSPLVAISDLKFDKNSTYGIEFAVPIEERPFPKYFLNQNFFDLIANSKIASLDADLKNDIVNFRKMEIYSYYPKIADRLFKIEMDTSIIKKIDVISGKNNTVYNILKTSQSDSQKIILELSRAKRNEKINIMDMIG